MVRTSPDRTMVTSTSPPNATLRGKRTASLFPLRKVRLSATAIATSFVITCIYEIFLGVARSGYIPRQNGKYRGTQSGIRRCLTRGLLAIVGAETVFRTEIATIGQRGRAVGR